MKSPRVPYFIRSDAPTGETVVALRETGARLDVRPNRYYVENWSLASDVLILMRTVKVVVAGNGAY